MSAIEENAGVAMKNSVRRTLDEVIKCYDPEGQVNILRLWKSTVEEMLGERGILTNIALECSIGISGVKPSKEDVKSAIESALENGGCRFA